MESARDTSNRVGAAAPTSLISSHEKRFQESFCVHTPGLVVRPTTLGISRWALWGLLHNLLSPNSSKTQFFRSWFYIGSMHNVDSSVLSRSIFRDDDVVSGRAHEQVTAPGAVHLEGGQLPRKVHKLARYRSGVQSVWLPTFTRLHSFVTKAPIQSPNPLSSALILWAPEQFHRTLFLTL
jgi:hypothetical protein